MKNLIKASVVSANLSKTLLYSAEYKILFRLSKLFSPFVAPPNKQEDPSLINYLRKGVIEIHKQDADNIANGVYPLEVIFPKASKNHLINFPHLLFDSLKISRRRKLKINKDLNTEEIADVPNYLHRNYHFQTGGYFSKESARLYEQQVEILFSGTAAPMRRMLIKFIKDRLNLSRPLRILEIGAGVGTATVDFSRSFSFSSYVVSDVSTAYLELARERLQGNFEFVKAQGESLPFKEEEFDLVFSVYLFHELPKNAREAVLSESFRVLKRGGLVAICDSIQIDDDKLLNTVVENFPKDYHEPFYKDYTLWDMSSSLKKSGFVDIFSEHKLLSKYWTAFKDDSVR